MFKWTRRSNKASYEPKTPKMASVSLPDERYTPIESHFGYPEKHHRDTLIRVNHDPRGMTPMLDAWATPPPMPSSGRSRVRTVSTPARDVQAPRPIRPHPSQGGFIPANDRLRRDHSRGPQMPVGVPSAAFLEEQIRRSQIETRTAPTRAPIDMDFGPGEFSDSEHPDARRLRDVARRNGAKVYSHASKAYLDELNEQQRREGLSKNSSERSVKKPRPPSGNPNDVVEFDDWKAVPVESEKYRPKTMDSNAPLKPALKRVPSQKEASAKQPLKSALKKTESSQDSKAYYSESESRRKHEDRMKPIKVIEIPSKAFLEEQKEKLEQIKQRGWASRQPPQPQARHVHEIRPSAFAHTSSSSTNSPTESLAGQYNPYSSRRSRHASVPEPTIPPTYQPAYIPRPDIGHGILSWPMTEYARRRMDGHPPVIFDAAYDPRDQRWPVKVNRGFHPTPLTREEAELPVVYQLHLPEMTIFNRELHMWPIHLKLRDDRNALKVIDVFAAIYDTYNQPLTEQEMRHLGEDVIRKCQPTFAKRCEESPQFTHIEERRGMLRLDLLRGRRKFKGLIPIYGRPFEWELVFE